MLKEILQLFTTKKITASPQKKKKYLSLQMHYVETKKPPSSKQITVVIPPIKKIETKKTVAKLTLDQLLEKQEKFLQSQPHLLNAKIEKIYLKEATRVVGFTSCHLKCQGMLAYPEAIRYTHQWDLLKKDAERQNTSLGIYEVNQNLKCLKITNMDGRIYFFITKLHLRLVNSRTPLTHCEQKMQQLVLP